MCGVPPLSVVGWVRVSCVTVVPPCVVFFCALTLWSTGVPPLNSGLNFSKLIQGMQ